MRVPELLIILIAILERSTTSKLLNSVKSVLITDPSAAEDADLDFLGLARKYGYEATAHKVTTEDSYDLTVFQMKANNIETNKTPILIGHGLIQTSDSFITSGPKYSPGFYLADHGYDLWFVNFRGNRYSKNLNITDESEYFDFSFHEMGVYDLPACIDYVLNATDSKRLNYIGYSQGTTAAFVMLSKRVEFNEKINLSINLAPIAWENDIRSPLLKIVATFTPEVQVFFNKTGQRELFAYGKPIQQSLEGLCKLSPAVAPICATPLMALAGFDSTQYPYERAVAIESHVPAGTSSKTIVHFGQLSQKDKFGEFDYGSADANIEVYGCATPPDYDLKLITAKTVLFWGENDWLSTWTNVQRLQSVLPNVLELYTVPYKLWSHLDFVVSKDVRRLVGDKILSLLD